MESHVVDSMTLARRLELEQQYAGHDHDQEPWYEPFLLLRKRLAIESCVLDMEQDPMVPAWTRRQRVRQQLANSFAQLKTEGLITVDLVEEAIAMALRVAEWESTHHFTQIRATVAAVLTCLQLHILLGPLPVEQQAAFTDEFMCVWRRAWSDLFELHPEPAALALAEATVAQAVAEAAL